MAKLADQMQAETHSFDVSEGKLQSLGNLVRQLRELESQLEDYTANCVSTKEHIEQITDRDIPDMMSELGFEEIKLLDDLGKLTIKTNYHASIKSDDKYLAHTWLKDHDYGDLIKNEVITKFGKGEDAKASKLVDNLAAQGYTLTQKEFVHPQTLKGFVRQTLEEGGTLPDSITVHIVRRATIK